VDRRKIPTKTPVVRRCCSLNPQRNLAAFAEREKAQWHRCITGLGPQRKGEKRSGSSVDSGRCRLGSAFPLFTLRQIPTAALADAYRNPISVEAQLAFPFSPERRWREAPDEGGRARIALAHPWGIFPSSACRHILPMGEGFCSERIEFMAATGHRRLRGLRRWIYPPHHRLIPNSR
jgi:hypothetical protein